MVAQVVVYQNFGPLQLLQLLIGLGSLVCFILVLIQMFQHGQTGLGIACILLFFCLAIGALVAFIVGWVNASRWRINNLMMAWTALLVVGIVLGVIGFAMMPKVVVVPGG